MKYNTHDIRRQDRLMDEQRARQLLHEAEYSVISMIDDQGLPYGIPVNAVFESPDHAYIHCAPEGKKLRALAVHPDVSMCIIGHVHLVPDKFTTEYESVILKGRAHLVTNDEERRHAIELILDKYSPKFKERGLFYATKSLPRTSILRIDISEFSGKCKKMH
ncbi:MAG: pyridoxamine 5'-phosphate oxidase family protein [Prevotella sp.]|jgi:nitroimidazol reductase NimA-like FMN-containing flavoprotein (pyridoxamine 5'-phosphate oxidase superfamily)